MKVTVKTASLSSKLGNKLFSRLTARLALVLILAVEIAFFWFLAIYCNNLDVIGS